MTKTEQGHSFAGMVEAARYLRGEGFTAFYANGRVAYWWRERDGARAVARSTEQGAGVTINWENKDD